jgi:hypothetical protein
MILKCHHLRVSLRDLAFVVVYQLAKPNAKSKNRSSSKILGN